MMVKERKIYRKIFVNGEAFLLKATTDRDTDIIANNNVNTKKGILSFDPIFPFLILFICFSLNGKFSFFIYLSSSY